MEQTGSPAFGILLAAGSGDRLGLAVPKGFIDLDGRPMFELSLMAMAASGVVGGVILVVPPGGRPDAVEETIERWRSAPGGCSVLGVISGGGSRQASVQMGLEALEPFSAGASVVVCHDAARPLASPELYRRVVAALAASDGAIPVVASPDTVKRVRDGRVVETIPRGEVGLAQTPQAFRLPALREAHRRAQEAGTEATDDAMLLESAGHAVAVVEGEPTNFKVTTAEDLQRAADALARRRTPGSGSDG